MQQSDLAVTVYGPPPPPDRTGADSKPPPGTPTRAETVRHLLGWTVCAALLLVGYWGCSAGFRWDAWTGGP